MRWRATADRARPAVDIALSLGTNRSKLPLQAYESEADFATHDQLWTLLNAMGVSREDVEIHQHGIGDIIVSASRRAESLQRTAIPVSAITAALVRTI